MWRIGLAWLAMVATPALAITFSAGLDNSHWQNQGDIFECRLKHPIPGYGNAEFVTRAGEQASFILTSWQRPMQKGRAEVVQQPPHWDQLSQAFSLGDIKVRAGRQPIRLAGPLPTQMLRSLQGGQGTAIRRLSWFNSKELIDVRLSTVNFQTAYRDYMSCLGTLLPVNFDQIRRTALYFESNGGVLSEENTEVLDSIALYIQADPDVAQIIIDGHTDDIGRRLKNRELSRERAAEVREYLTRFGIDESIILVRFHGERYPAVKNNSKKNRALNRRVTLQLKKRYEFERDQRRAARRATQIEESIEAGAQSERAKGNGSSTNSSSGGGQAPANTPREATSKPKPPALPAEFAQDPGATTARSTVSKQRPVVQEPVILPPAEDNAAPAAREPVAPAPSTPPLASSPPLETAPSVAAGAEPSPFSSPESDAAVPTQARSDKASVLDSALPTSGLNSALPSSGLDSDLPSSGLDTALPSSGDSLDDSAGSGSDQPVQAAPETSATSAAG